jgi:TonB family protein
MFALRAVIAAAAVFSTAAPGLAADSIVLRGVLVADLGHDQTALASNGSEARIVRAAVPERAYFDTLTNAVGRVTVALTLTAAGRVAGARVLATSGRQTLDASAVDAVRASTYAAATAVGRPIGGVYAVDVVFEPADSP